MNTETITILNLGLHGLLLGALGLAVVYGCVRDARRRAHASAMAVWLAVITPWVVLMWPLPQRAPEAMPVPAAAPSRLPMEWRIKVEAAAPEITLPPLAAAQLARPVWTMNRAALLLTWVWGIGFALMACHHLLRTWLALGWRLRRPTDEELGKLPENLRATNLRVFDHEGSPCVSGLFRPVIAVPASAFQSLDAQRWRWLLRHEAEHVRGIDVLYAWLLGWARAVAWWNPFVHALIEQWARAREEVCDAAAVGDTEATEPYAEFLLEVAASRSGLTPCTVPMAQSRPARRLKARLSALLSMQRVREHLGWAYATMALLSWLVGYGLIASVGIAQVPGQPAESKETNAKVAATEAETGELFTQTFRVRPDLLTTVSPASKPPSAPPANPFAPADATAPALKPRLTAKQWLERKDIVFPEGANAVFNPVTSQLIVKHTKTVLGQVAAIIAEANLIPPQILVRTRLIQGDEWFGRHGQLLTPAAAEVFRNGLQQKRGVDLMSGPSVTMKMEQRALIEVVREGIVGGAVKELKFAGLQVEVFPQKAQGGKVALSGTVTLHWDPARTTPWDLSEPENINWAGIKTTRHPWAATLSTGQTIVLHLSGLQRPVTMTLTAEALKPDGTPAASFERISATPQGSITEGKLEPASSYDKRLQDAKAGAEQAKREQDAAARKQIYLSAKIVDVVHDQGTVFDLLNLDALAKRVFSLSGTSASAGSTPAPAPEVITPAPGVLAVSGVFTDPQFQVVLRALNQIKGTTLSTLPSATSKSGVKVDMAFPAAAGQGQLHVVPVIGPDGFTIDLEVAIEMAATGAVPGPLGTRQVTTSVSIWDGQTVVFGGELGQDNAGKHSRLIFVTGQIIDPQGQPAAK